MEKAKCQNDGPSRRMSMLPKKTSIKSFSKPVASLPKDGSRDAERQYATLAETQTSAVLRATLNKADTILPPFQLPLDASMPPPASLGQKGLQKDSAKIDRIPKGPSTGRKPSHDRNADIACSGQHLRNWSQPQPQARKSSGRWNSQSDAKESYRGRSLSQQVRPTATSGHLQSKTLSQRQSSMKNPRPALSGVQQHLNPKKAIQADSSTLSSQPMCSDATPSGDIFHLQMDLAQLHVLHRSVFSVQIQWEKSARESLEHQFSALYERHIELKEVAHQQQTLMNQFSLVQWSQGRSGPQIADKVQLLSHNVSDVCNLLDPDGKQSHILKVFESWFTQALRVRGQRESNSKNSGRDLDFVEGIGDGWKAEAMVLEREMTYSARDLEGFGEFSSTSSLGRLLSTYRRLVSGLLEELDIIQWIENEIMAQEASWIERTIRNLASNVSGSIGSLCANQEIV